MEQNITSPQKANTKSFPLFGQNSGISEKEKSNRKSQKTALAKQAIHSTKERIRRRKTNFRFVDSKFIYKVPNIQNANTKGSKITSSQKLLDSIHRLEGRLLAYSHSQNKKALPRFLLQECRLPVQSNALRSKCSPSRIHQSYSSCDKGDGGSRHLVPSLPRRSSDNCKDKRGVYKTCTIGHKNPRILGLDNELQKIKIRTFSNLRMARDSVQPGNPYSTSLFRKDKVSTKETQGSDKFRLLLKKNNNAVARSGQLDRSIRPIGQTNALGYKKHSQNIQEASLRRAITIEQRNETGPMQMDNRLIHTTSPGQPSPGSYSTDRCATGRLGIHDQQNPIFGGFRQNYDLLHKYPGAANSLVFPTHDQKEGSNNSHQVRQRSGSFIGEEREVDQPSLISPSRPDLEEGDPAELDPFYLSHQRQLQCDSGPTFQESSPINRMVTSPGSVSADLGQEQGSSGGLICNQPELPVTQIHVSLPGQGCDRSRRPSDSLGSVESPLHLSSNQANFQGFGEAEDNTVHQRSFSDSGHPDQTMVHGIDDETSAINGPGNRSPTTSKRHFDKEHDYQTSRVAVIGREFERVHKLTGCQRALGLMVKPIVDSSIKDYQHKWQCFLNFLSSKQVELENVSFSNVLQFFIQLFYDKHLKSGTITKYRSALAKPLLHYNIDLKVPAITDLIRGMTLQRPNNPVSAPSWSLNKVLIFLDGLVEPISDIMLLRKTAFLLLLATGWRVSELHACVANEEYCCFTRDFKLKLRPQPSFLAKNECKRKRWVHKVIPSLINEDGTNSNLCPVTMLSKYLQQNSITEGPLFRTKSIKKQEMTIHSLGAHICSLIAEADPNTKAAVHDVRKYATSCALAETMLVGDLANEMNWSSPAVFFKYYLTATAPLARPVVLPLSNSKDQL